MSKYDGRLYTQAEFDEARYGTYANKSTDTSGLGEYSDAQLLKELVNRGVIKEHEIIYVDESSEITDEQLEVFNNFIGGDPLAGFPTIRAKEIIGE